MLSLCRGLTRADALKILGADIGPEMCLGHWVAAVRELFEETGILVLLMKTAGRPTFRKRMSQKG